MRIKRSKPPIDPKKIEEYSSCIRYNRPSSPADLISRLVKITETIADWEPKEEKSIHPQQVVLLDDLANHLTAIYARLDAIESRFDPGEDNAD